MRHVILIELDALLDTRLGAMRVYNERCWANTWQDPAYFNRLIDDFEHFGAGTTMMWRNIYNQRGTLLDEDGVSKVLRASTMSCMSGMIGMNLLKTYSRKTTDPAFVGTDVVINTWPYQLSEIEEGELILALEQMMLPDESKAEVEIIDTDITTISIPPEELTLASINGRYSQIVMYNFNEWWDIQAKAVFEAEEGAVLTEFIVPELLRARPKKPFKDHTGTLYNPFEETKRILAVSMKMVFWSPAYFSIPNPRELLEEKKV